MKVAWSDPRSVPAGRIRRRERENADRAEYADPWKQVLAIGRAVRLARQIRTVQGDVKLEWDSLERRIEAIVFAAGEPIELIKIAQALDVGENVVRHCVDRIRERYAEQKSPFDLALLDSAVQMCTLAEYGPAIRAALELRREAPISQAALEVLAAVAYNQPVTRSFIEQIRGVDCSTILRSLAEKGLIEEAGRLQIPGKPIAYRTTANFLRSFGLANLEQLPVLPGESGEEAEALPDVLDGQMDFFEV